MNPQDWETARKLADLDAAAIGASLCAEGHAVIDGLLTPSLCRALRELYVEDGYRKHIVMQQHGYGRGAY